MAGTPQRGPGTAPPPPAWSLGRALGARRLNVAAGGSIHRCDDGGLLERLAIPFFALARMGTATSPEIIGARTISQSDIN